MKQLCKEKVFVALGVAIGGQSGAGLRDIFAKIRGLFFLTGGASGGLFKLLLMDGLLFGLLLLVGELFEPEEVFARLLIEDLLDEGDVALNARDDDVFQSVDSSARDLDDLVQGEVRRLPIAPTLACRLAICTSSSSSFLKRSLHFVIAWPPCSRPRGTVSVLEAAA